MATHKREHFTEAEQRLAAVAKALGHPARVAIVRLLAQRRACVCGELVLELPLSQSTVSQHLKELKAAGLVQGDIDGPRVCYCLDPAGWAVARQLLGELLAAMHTATARCAGRRQLLLMPAAAHSLASFADSPPFSIPEHHLKMYLSETESSASTGLACRARFACPTALTCLPISTSRKWASITQALHRLRRAWSGAKRRPTSSSGRPATTTTGWPRRNFCTFSTSRRRILGREDLDIEVEYQQATIGKFGLAFDGTDFRAHAQANGLPGAGCLRHSQPTCWPWPQLQAASGCTPGGGCC